MVKTVKKENIVRGGRSTRTSARNIDEAQDTCDADNATVERRVLRSKYLSFKNRICDEKEDISKVDSEKFKSIIEEVDSLHQLVQKPREQVADAEALFDITNTLVSSVRAFKNDGVTPLDFISCLTRDFGQHGEEARSSLDGGSTMNWQGIGNMISHVFLSARGCCTMVGPMNTEVKQRKNVVHRKCTKPTEDERPEEINNSAEEEKTDTDKNMATMFNILRKNRKSNLENLVLNRSSFAQTVENVFALSFLIKDGRAEITVNEDGCHFVSPRNAPSANAILSGEASYSHFIFRFDFKDWKLMLASVKVGDELMPHRTQPASNPKERQEVPPQSTPIKKLSRNRGLVMQEQTVVQDSPESIDSAAARASATRKGKRKLI